MNDIATELEKSINNYLPQLRALEDSKASVKPSSLKSRKMGRLFGDDVY